MRFPKFGIHLCPYKVVFVILMLNSDFTENMDERCDIILFVVDDKNT